MNPPTNPTRGAAHAANQRAYASALAAGQPAYPLGLGVLGLASLVVYLNLPHSKALASRRFKRAYGLLLLALQVHLSTAYAVPSTLAGYGLGILNVWTFLAFLAFVYQHDAKASFARIVRVKTPKGPPRYVWQPFPRDSLVARLSWTLDLLSNVRGIGWSWQTHDVPGLPNAVLKQLAPEYLSPAHRQGAVSRVGCVRHDTHRALRADVLRTLATYLVMAPVILYIVLHDPYFHGHASAPPPFFITQHTPAELHHPLSFLTRGFTPILMTILPLRALSALCALALTTLGPALAGLHAEPWTHPSFNGALLNAWDYGVTGFWNGTWHQMFRHVLGASTAALLDEVGFAGRGFSTQVARVMAVFFLSALLHAVSTHMMVSGTRAWTGSFLFFWLQGVVVIAEGVWRKVYRATGLARIVPRWLARVIVGVYVVVYACWAIRLFAEDQAAGGFYLYDALPVPYLERAMA